MGLKLVWTKKPDFFLLEDRKRIEFREEAGDNLHLQQFLKEVEVAFSGGYGDRHTMLNVQFLSKNRNTGCLLQVLMRRLKIITKSTHENQARGNRKICKYKLS